MDFTDADYATGKYERLARLFKSKTNQPFLKPFPLQLTLSYCFFPVLFFSSCTQACVFEGPAPYFTFICMNVCLYLYVHILYGHCVMFVYREGSCGFSLTTMSCRQFHFCCFLCFSSTCVYHLSLLSYISFRPAP